MDPAEIRVQALQFALEHNRSILSPADKVIETATIFERFLTGHASEGPELKAVA